MDGKPGTTLSHQKATPPGEGISAPDRGTCPRMHFPCALPTQLPGPQAVSEARSLTSGLSRQRFNSRHNSPLTTP